MQCFAVFPYHSISTRTDATSPFASRSSALPSSSSNPPESHALSNATQTGVPIVASSCVAALLWLFSSSLSLTTISASSVTISISSSIWICTSSVASLLFPSLA
eukprot:1082493_1